VVPLFGSIRVMENWSIVVLMALRGSGRLIQAEKSRTLIYVSQKVVSDSAFPFTPGDALTIRIDGKRLIVEVAEVKKPKRA
jgi:hypothetical protein